MGRQGYSAIKLLGIEGKKVDIIPQSANQEYRVTEIYNKKFEYLGKIIFDKGWKKYVLYELNRKMQMSKDCILEAFELTEKYWKGE